MNIKFINKLITVLENSGISEIEITDFWGRKIKIIKSASVSHSSTLSTPKVIVEDPKKVDEKKNEGTTKNTVPIRSPIVGTFYRAPSPDAPPYVEVGDIIKPGQVVCIVEAMKLMNEIESDVAGRVIQILAKNEDPVEYNQALFLVEPL
jgi:acetyl-CoA carboxylase biotin carboxyl carrier protein